MSERLEATEPEAHNHRVMLLLTERQHAAFLGLANREPLAAWCRRRLIELAQSELAQAAPKRGKP